MHDIVALARYEASAYQALMGKIENDGGCWPERRSRQ